MPTFISILFVLLAALIQGAEAAPAEYRPQGSVRDYFLGAWKLVSTQDRYPDGHTSPYPGLGPDALGFLIYAPSGHMCAQLMKRQRSPWAAGDKPTPEEAVAALDGFTSYCGTFELNESEHTIVHRPQTAGSPNWVGTMQLRPYHLVSKDRFFFEGVEKEKQKDGTEISVRWTITWERLK